MGDIRWAHDLGKTIALDSVGSSVSLGKLGCLSEVIYKNTVYGADLSYMTATILSVTVSPNSMESVLVPF